MHRFLVLAAAFIGAPATAATFYVAPTGNDAGAGTEAAPWQSFAHAQELARPGDTVLFRGGRYAYTHATTNCASRATPEKRPDPHVCSHGSPTK